MTLVGHTDAVWSLTSLPHPVNPLVASSSADGTVRLWSLAAALQGTDTSALECVLQIKKLCNATPTSVRAGHTQQQIAIGRSDGKVSIFDLANGGSKEVCVLSGSGSIGSSRALLLGQQRDLAMRDIEKRDAGNHPTPEQCNALAVHPTEPLIVTAHEDKSVRLYDTRTGQCEYSMVAHLDSVGSIDYSADGKTVITGGSACLMSKFTCSCLTFCRARLFCSLLELCSGSVLQEPAVLYTRVHRSSAEKRRGCLFSRNAKNCK